MNRNDVLAYLFVLGCDKLNTAERQTAGQHLVGCLVRFREQLEANPSFADLSALVAHREKLNCMHPLGQPELVAATRTCIEVIRERCL